MSSHVKIASPKDFSTLVKKGKNIENGLLGKGVIKHYSSSSSHDDIKNNRKPKFWSKNKGIMHDGVTDVKSVQNLQGGNNNNNYHNWNNTNLNHENQNQSNQQSRNQTQFLSCNNNNTNSNYNHDYDQNRKFTNFHEPLDAIFQKLMECN